MRRPRDSRELFHSERPRLSYHGNSRDVRFSCGRQRKGGSASWASAPPGLPSHSGLSCPQPNAGERITLRHDQCCFERECAEESFAVKLSMSLRPQQSQKRVQALAMALISATLSAACHPNRNPTPSPVPRVPTPTPSPEPNREPDQPVKPQTTADASTHVLARSFVEGHL
jgi:hypothetical protein